VGETEITVRPAVLAGAAVVGAALILLLVLVLLQLHRSQESIDHQEKIANTLLERATPVLRSSRPLVNSINEALPPLKRTRRQIGSALGEVPGIATSAERLAAEGGDALRRLQGVDLGVLANVLTRASSVLEEVDATDLVDRTGRSLDQLSALEDRARRAFSDLETIVAIQRRTVSLQRRSFRTQRHSLGVQTHSLGIQRRTLRHARRIDRRLGGGLPAPVP
jgi:hypothetical protein